MDSISTITKDLNQDDDILLDDIVKEFPDPELVLAVKVNGMAFNNNEVLHRFGKDVSFQPIYKNSIEGESILRRSFVFLLGMAISRLAGEKEQPTWFVRHPVRSGYFCEFEGVAKVEEKMIEDIEKMMRELSAKKLPISKTCMFYKDAKNLFKETNQPLTVKLMECHNFFDVPLDVCDGYCNIHHRVLVPNTSFLTEFKLKKRKHGFLLLHLFKKMDEFYQSPVEVEDKRTVDILKEQSDYIKKVGGVVCIGDVNKLAYRSTDIKTFVEACNSFHDRLMNILVQKIVRDQMKELRLILIAGPSASGKTTFASNLRKKLQFEGIKTYMISVDNYFRPNKDLPIDPISNRPDFENLVAVRIDLLNEHLIKLFKGEKVMTPKFDFHKGEPIDDFFPLQIEKSSVLIMEGIHCLNEKLTPLIPSEQKYKIFVSPLSVINYDDRNYISNTALRLIRRIVRDSMHRGHSVEATLQMWDSVKRAEHKYIFPYMNEASFIFNTAFDYEVGVLKKYVKPLLRTVPHDSIYFDKAQQLIRLLMFVTTVPYKYVPKDSLLQEFIGAHFSN